MTDHTRCPTVLVERMREIGCEIRVETDRSNALGPYQQAGFVCPHGTSYWIYPTDEQIAEWDRLGVE